MLPEGGRQLAGGLAVFGSGKFTGTPDALVASIVIGVWHWEVVNPVPPSLSTTVVRTVNRPRSEVVCVPEIVPVVFEPPRIAGAGPVPSPHLIVPVCVSKIPGSLKTPERLRFVPTGAGVAIIDIGPTVGGTFATVTLVVSTSLKP